MKLFEINRAIDEILSKYLYLGDDLVDAETGEVQEKEATDKILEELDELQVAREEKLENIACWIKGMDAEMAAIKAEEKKLSERRKSVENKRNRIFDFLQFSLNGEKISSPRVKVSYRKTEAVEVTDPENLSAQFKRIKTIEEPNKEAIKKAIKAGELVDGASLVERMSMSVK